MPEFHARERHTIEVAAAPERVFAALREVTLGEMPLVRALVRAAPGYAKMALNFRFDGTVLSTETRVFLTDAAARRSFRRYWLVIRPFSGLTRRLWLRAVKHRAEPDN
jgi:hypothetical protein